MELANPAEVRVKYHLPVPNLENKVMMQYIHKNVEYTVTKSIVCKDT
jgi:hypothetical protein